jgi:hypothetical protein
MVNPQELTWMGTDHSWHVFKAFTARNLPKVVAYTAIDDMKLITIFRGVATAQLDLALCELRIPCVFTALRCNMLRICPMTLEPQPIQRMPQNMILTVDSTAQQQHLGTCLGTRYCNLQVTQPWELGLDPANPSWSGWFPPQAYRFCLFIWKAVFDHQIAVMYPVLMLTLLDLSNPIYIIIYCNILCSMPMLPES